MFDEIPFGSLHLPLLDFPNKPSVMIQKPINSFLDDLSCVLPSAGGHLTQECLFSGVKVNFHSASLAVENRLSTNRRIETVRLLPKALFGLPSPSASSLRQRIQCRYRREFRSRFE